MLSNCFKKQTHQPTQPEPIKIIKKSLLIGCDYEGTDSELKGCSKDVEEMDKFLLPKKYQNLILCDDTERNLTNVTDLPTEKNIKYHMKNILEPSENNKYFVHFSGHGYFTHEPFSNTDELDGRDEMIFSSDLVSITDDVFNDFFDHLPKKCKVFILIDACHSGTMGDLRYRLSEENFKEIIESSDNHNKADIVMISGCKDSQTSADAFLNGSYRGAMTSAFLNSFDENLTINDLVLKMREWLKKNKFPQVPQLTYNVKEAFNRKIVEYL